MTYNNVDTCMAAIVVNTASASVQEMAARKATCVCRLCQGSFPLQCHPLQRVEPRSTEIFQSQLVAREKHLFLRRGGLYNPSAPFSKRWQGNQLSQVRTL